MSWELEERMGYSGGAVNATATELIPRLWGEAKSLGMRERAEVLSEWGANRKRPSLLASGSGRERGSDECAGV